MRTGLLVGCIRRMKPILGMRRPGVLGATQISCAIVANRFEALQHDRTRSIRLSLLSYWLSAYNRVAGSHVGWWWVESGGRILGNQ